MRRPRKTLGSIAVDIGFDLVAWPRDEPLTVTQLNTKRLQTNKLTVTQAGV
jgi:hypothetical protein